jgi:hypothetical protein
MTISLRARTLLALTCTAIVLCIALLLGQATPAHAAVAGADATGYKCDYDIAYGAPVPIGTTKRCWAPSTLYPNLQGWYAKIGRPGDCSYAPFKRYFAQGYVGPVCIAMPRYDAYTLVDGAWKAGKVSVGATGYVYPYAQGWRWVYVNNGWVAMRALDVGIYW